MSVPVTSIARLSIRSLRNASIHNLSGKSLEPLGGRRPLKMQSLRLDIELRYQTAACGEVYSCTVSRASRTMMKRKRRKKETPIKTALFMIKMFKENLNQQRAEKNFLLKRYSNQKLKFVRRYSFRSISGPKL